MLAIQAVIDDVAFRIELFEQRLSIPGQTCCKHNYLVVWCDCCEKFVAVRSFASIDLLVHHLVRYIRDVDRQNKVCIAHRLELRVYQSLIKV